MSRVRAGLEKGRMALSVGSETANLLCYGRARYWLVGFAFLGEWGESFLSVDWLPSPERRQLRDVFFVFGRGMAQASVPLKRGVGTTVLGSC